MNIALTIEWASRFRSAAAEMPDEPPPDVDPILWKAQRDALLYQAEHLEAEAREGTMHYKNGREARNGDKVVLLSSWGPPVIGILYDAQAGNDYCNGKIARIGPNDTCPNLKECLHLDDVLAAIEADPRAAAPQDPTSA